MLIIGTIIGFYAGYLLARWDYRRQEQLLMDTIERQERELYENKVISG